ncbi:YggS family pyridoxal phosphate-dependent enzyme [Myxococcota bacterium]|nr:YggS family pyridoxal phosphate-dependent enzyme [Myxococcota bacterium]
MTEISQRLESVRRRIESAALRAGRDPSEITLVGVSKKIASSKVADALDAGLDHVGENYVQEAVAKIAELRASRSDPVSGSPVWHFIGQLQRNKARHVATHFDVVETVDRVALGAELDKRAGAAGRRLEILLQVDLSGERTKGGIEPGGLKELLAISQDWAHLQVTGLMTIPAPATEPEANRLPFRALRELRDTLSGTPGGGKLSKLSMGMSGDFEVAVEEGATIVRVGTGIFGLRDSPT